jgi:hypothetical protein
VISKCPDSFHLSDFAVPRKTFKKANDPIPSTHKPDKIALFPAPPFLKNVGQDSTWPTFVRCCKIQPGSGASPGNDGIGGSFDIIPGTELPSLPSIFQPKPSLRLTQRLGLKSWLKLTASEQREWKTAIGKMKSFDFRPIESISINITRQANLQISQQRYDELSKMFLSQAFHEGIPVPVAGRE